MDVEIIIWLITVITALSVGSFINVLVYRLPQFLSEPHSVLALCRPRSHCPDCKTPLRWRDNIPLVSWLIPGGKCFYCQSAISLRYPVTEAITAAISFFLAWLLPPVPELLCALLLCWLLLALAFIDIEHQLLPDALTFLLLWSGLLLHVFAVLPGNLADAVSGAAIGYSTLWLLATGYRGLRGHEGLGMGDAKLLAALGAWLGWQMLPALLIIAAGGGLFLLLLTKLCFNHDLHRTIPFGPWISLAGFYLYVKQLV